MASSATDAAPMTYQGGAQTEPCVPWLIAVRMVGAKPPNTVKAPL
jgi:hypothetical protein